jgi:hypothetical protein
MKAASGEKSGAFAPMPDVPWTRVLGAFGAAGAVNTEPEGLSVKTKVVESGDHCGKKKAPPTVTA